MKLWMLLAAAGLAAFVLGSTYWLGRRAGEADCELRVERSIVAEQKRQSAAFEESLDAAAKRATETEAENASLQDSVTKYEAELARRTGACVLDKDDAAKLGNIR